MKLSIETYNEVLDTDCKHCYNISFLLMLCNLCCSRFEGITPELVSFAENLCGRRALPFRNWLQNGPFQWIRFPVHFRYRRGKFNWDNLSSFQFCCCFPFTLLGLGRSSCFWILDFVSPPFDFLCGILFGSSIETKFNLFEWNSLEMDWTLKYSTFTLLPIR